ncbi:MAG: hypothetical protein ACTS5P_00295 [Candidatus Hodgkinia cicadicola]
MINAMELFHQNRSIVNKMIFTNTTVQSEICFKAKRLRRILLSLQSACATNYALRLSNITICINYKQLQVQF